MAQSFTRKIKRQNLIPVWNEATFNFDFYKRIKSSGMYAITLNPYGNYPVKGPGITYEKVLALQKNSEYTPEEKKHYEKMMKELKKQVQQGFFKRTFNKLLGKK